MPTARITQTWTDGSQTELLLDSDDPAHPDLLDEMVARVLAMWRATVVDGE